MGVLLHQNENIIQQHCQKGAFLIDCPLFENLAQIQAIQIRISFLKGFLHQISHCSLLHVHQHIQNHRNYLILDRKQPIPNSRTIIKFNDESGTNLFCGGCTLAPLLQITHYLLGDD